MQTQQLASLIRFHRKRAGLSQNELAEHAGVSRYVVQDLEAAGGRTTWTRLLAVLETLSIDLAPAGSLVDEWRAREAADSKGGSGDE
jgi:HTH-type transcriptional regulator/antitoxin HipB